MSNVAAKQGRGLVSKTKSSRAGAANGTAAPWRFPEGGKDVWGPVGWGYGHKIAIHYPPRPTFEDAYQATQKIWSLVLSLPCAECRQHATQYLREHPPDLRSNHAAQRWWWGFHNAVNQRLGKAFFTWGEYQRKYAAEIARSRAHSRIA